MGELSTVVLQCHMDQFPKCALAVVLNAERNGIGAENERLQDENERLWRENERLLQENERLAMASS